MKKWTDADDKIREMHKAGKSYTEIALALGYHGGSVKRRLTAMGLTPKRNFWHDTDDLKLVNMREAGMPFSKIAKALGRNDSSCQERYKILMGNGDDMDKHWPPKKDPWAVKTNFAEHDLKLKPTRTVVKNTDHSQLRSLVGNSSAMCAK